MGITNLVALAALVFLVSSATCEEAVPAFPLSNPVFDEILDRLPENSDDAQQIEFKAFEYVLHSLKLADSATIEDSTEHLTFNKLFANLEKYRGHVTTVTGSPIAFQKMTLPQNAAAIDEIWIGQVAAQAGQLITSVSLSKVDIGHPIYATGVVLKRLAFFNRAPGNKLTWTPLVIAKSVQNLPGIVPQTEDKLALRLPRENWTDGILTPEPLYAAVVEKNGVWTGRFWLEEIHP